MPIRSHKIPKAYLKRFATEPKKQKFGKLCVYERGKRPRTGTPNSEAAERGFFTSRSQNGTLEDSPAEAWAQAIEDCALDTLIHAPSPMFVWTRENRRRMAEYWALMFLRSTSFFDFHKSGAESTFRRQMTRLNTDMEFRHKIVSYYSFLMGRLIKEEELLGSVSRAVESLLTAEGLRHEYVQQLKRRVDLFSTIFLNKPWQIWTTPSDDNFVTCDSPVMSFRLDEWGRYFVGDGLGKESSIVLLPLSPEACLLAGLQGPQSRHIPKSDVREVNKIIVSSSARFVYSRTEDLAVNRLVQSHAGTIRYGINAFTPDKTDSLDDLFF